MSQYERFHEEYFAIPCDVVSMLFDVMTYVLTLRRSFHTCVRYYDVRFDV